MRRSHVYERSAPRKARPTGANRNLRLNRCDEPNAMSRLLAGIRLIEPDSAEGREIEELRQRALAIERETEL